MRSLSFKRHRLPGATNLTVLSFIRIGRILKPEAGVSGRQPDGDQSQVRPSLKGYR